jgi:hypothetical protein
MATSTAQSRAQSANSTTGPVELPDAVARIAAATPERIVALYCDRALTYRDLDAAINLMMPVIRGQRMDDRSAVIAAIFAGLPALGGESDPALVAAVVDGAVGTISTDIMDLHDATTIEPLRATGTSEIDLRVIASRLTGA